MKKDTHGRPLPKSFKVEPCIEHGFRSGYFLCAYCNDMRERVVKKLHLEVR